MSEINRGVWVGETWYDTGPVINLQVPENVRRFTGILNSEGKAVFKEPNQIGFGGKQNIYSVER